jgi:DnaJ family protein A protein 2
MIKSNPGEIISPGVIKTVKGLGMPFLENSYKHGNLYINFNIEFPKSLDPNQLEDLMKILKTQKKKPASDKIDDSFYVSEFKPDEVNTSERGGKKKESENKNNEDEHEHGHPNVKCANQ